MMTGIHVPPKSPERHKQRQHALHELIARKFQVTRAAGQRIFDVTMRHMTKKSTPASRRRASPSLGRKTFVYFTDEERTLIDEAAKLERRSISSFVANAALAAAEMTTRRTHAKK